LIQFWCMIQNPLSLPVLVDTSEAPVLLDDSEVSIPGGWFWGFQSWRIILIPVLVGDSEFPVLVDDLRLPDNHKCPGTLSNPLILRDGWFWSFQSKWTIIGAQTCIHRDLFLMHSLKSTDTSYSWWTIQNTLGIPHKWGSTMLAAVRV